MQRAKPLQEAARPHTEKGYRTKRLVLRGLVYLFAAAVAVTAFYPFFVMLIGATHDSYNIVTQMNVLPGNYLARNYERLTQTMDIWRGLANSLLVSTLSTVAALYVSSLAAYGFSKFRFRGRGFLFGVVLVAMMLPSQIGIIGYYKLIDAMGLLDSYIGLIASSATNCFAVFLFTQYLDSSLPNDMVEAGLIDGCGEGHIFHRLALPMMRPILVAQGVLSFIGSWNSYMNPLILLYSREKMTLPLLIASVRDAMTTDYGAQFVGMLISVLPLVVVFCFASKVIMEEISVGTAIKG